MLDVKALGDLSAALLTPVIGVVTTIILVNQHRLEKRKLRLQLFEKRLRCVFGSDGIHHDDNAGGKEHYGRSSIISARLP
jgi:hypothetical protein